MNQPTDVGSLVDRTELEERLAKQGYLPDGRTTLALWIALTLGRPLLVEGPAGVGKTELARAAALALGRTLIRLSCYEGLDEAKALYEWDYAKQILYTQLCRDALAKTVEGAAGLGEAIDRVARSEANFFDRRFLIPRPLLRAIESDTPTVLLIDEVDRADPEFEALLLELLSDFTVTIPELGASVAKARPLCILTTNGTREMTDALRRRCLFAYMDYPSPDRELAILRARIPDIDAHLAERVVEFVENLRSLKLKKTPSIGETLDFARTLQALGHRTLSDTTVRETLGVLLKHFDDQTTAELRLEDLLKPARA